MNLQENIPVHIRRRIHSIDKVIDNLLPNMYPCDYNSSDHFVEGVLDEIFYLLRDEPNLYGIDLISINDFILDHKYDELTDYFNEHCIVLKNDNLQESIRRILREEKKKEKTQYHQYKLGDVIDGSKLDELSGGLVGNDNNQYVLVQYPLYKFPYTRQDLIDSDPEYAEEEIWRLESIKDNFDKTPPIPQEGDGLHRIIAAKELGYKTILMWKKITNLQESKRRILREIEEDRVQIRLGRNAERHFGAVQNIIISVDGEDITSEDDVPGLGKMNIVIKDGEIIVGDIFIPEKYRRKGIATVVYQKISDYFGLPIVSSTVKGFNQTKEGGYIWKNRDKFKPRNLQESIRRILREEVTKDENLYGEKLKPCSTKPMTGFYRDGYCRTGDDDTGSHTVCAKVTEEFLEFTNSMGNNLDMLEPGDKWCLCAMRWKEAKDNGIYVKVDKSATNIKTIDIINSSDEIIESEITERCWKGYTQKGMKTMFGKRYPNCVKIKKKK